MTGPFNMTADEMRDFFREEMRHDALIDQLDPFDDETHDLEAAEDNREII